MVALKIFVVLLGVLAFTTDSYGQTASISPRMSNGIPADTMRRFPHHVTIQPRYHGANGKQLPICGGSIIHKQWVLTSLKCVEKGDILEVHFQKLYKNSTAGSYAIVLNNDETSVYKFPTIFDDVALIKLSVLLIPSITVSPIALSSSPSAQLQKKLVVLPGFENKENGGSSQKGQLTYAMMNLASHDVCINSYQHIYDEFLNLCGVPYNKRSFPCLHEYGGGVLINWPSKPELVGIYSSTSRDCDSSSPSVFINIKKYRSWIMEHIREEPYLTTTMRPWTSTTTAAPA